MATQDRNGNFSAVGADRTDKRDSEQSRDSAGIFWKDLAGLNLSQVCDRCLAVAEGTDRLVLPFLGCSLQVDISRRRLDFPQGDRLGLTGDSLLELMTLGYLCQTGSGDVAGEMVGVKDLKEGHFFQGPHALPLDLPLARFGRDTQRFRAAAARLQGEPLDLADAAFAFSPYPKIPIYCLLWEGDEEFPAEMKVLFDRSIEHHLQADAIWGIVHLVVKALLWADGQT